MGVSLDQDGDLILVWRFMARYKPVPPNCRKKPTEEGGREESAFRQAMLPGWNATLPASFFYAKDGRWDALSASATAKPRREPSARCLIWVPVTGQNLRSRPIRPGRIEDRFKAKQAAGPDGSRAKLAALHKGVVRVGGAPPATTCAAGCAITRESRTCAWGRFFA